MGYLPDINNLTDDCERCGNAVELRFKVRDRLGETGYVCGICGWMVSSGRDLHIETVCRACGCSDNASCPTGCWWVELERAAGVGLCSNCAPKGSA